MAGSAYETSHSFETPENVLVAYQPAGLGSRFFAWVIDMFVRTAIIIVLILAILFTGSLADELRELVSGWFDVLLSTMPETEDETATKAGSIVLIAFGIIILLWGLGSFAYFFLLEYLMRGQTIGKRVLNLRVVKADGFSLDAAAIFIRNIFRIVDENALLWIVPMFSKRNQRLGDMVAGTIVVKDEPASLSPLREYLLGRPVADLSYRIEGARLARLGSADVEAMELLLERWEKLTEEQQQQLSQRITENVTAKLQVQAPESYDQLVFLQDVLTQVYIRLSRQLG